MTQHEQTTVASPCINVCRMDAASGVCAGCFRTLAEISGWSRAANDEKRAILAANARRRAGNAPYSAGAQ